MEIGIEGETVRAGSGNVASGQQYAQQIAGGMPMSQVIAPGVSYSPDQPGGYTQADLNVIANLGIAPVMQPAPTQGPAYTIEDQMEYAPPGTTVRDLVPNEIIEPYLEFVPNYNVSSDIPFADISADTRFAPELSQDGNYYVPSKFDLDVEAFMEGVDPEILRNVDLTNLDLPESRGRPGIDYFPEPRDPFILKDFFSLPGQEKDTAGLLDPQPGPSAPAGFIPPPANSINTMAFVDYYNPTTGETWSAPNGGWTAPEGWVIGSPGDQPYPGSTVDSPLGIIADPSPSAAPFMPTQKYRELSPESSLSVSGQRQQPMNFTGLPNIPVPPAAQVYIPPPMPVPPAYTQPRVEDIIAPIRTGSPRRQQQPGLFSLV